jgi:hypothetical protein
MERRTTGVFMNGPTHSFATYFFIENLLPNHEPRFPPTTAMKGIPNPVNWLGRPASSGRACGCDGYHENAVSGVANGKTAFNCLTAEFQ